MSELKLVPEEEVSELDQTIIEALNEELQFELLNEGYQGVIKKYL